MVVKLGRTSAAFFALSWIVVEVVSFASSPPPLPALLAATNTVASSKSSRFQSNLYMCSTNKLCGDPPFLAILTEQDACTSVQRIDETIHAIERATVDGGVTLVVVRINDGDDETSENKWNLLKRLSELKQMRLSEGDDRNFLLVVNNDVELILKAISCNILVDGVHIKEYKAHLIPDIRQKLHDAMENAVVSNSNETKKQQGIIIGTSCHSMQSAFDSYNLSPRGPDYLFVGTCYLTESHPEKTSLDQLEGPALPGKIRETLHKSFAADDRSGDSDLDLSLSGAGVAKKPPVIFAIGGIDEKNCNEPVKYGADGVATIRTVMQADDPREVVKQMNTAMLN
jgi:thiamine monophosphate synthase